MGKEAVLGGEGWITTGSVTNSHGSGDSTEIDEPNVGWGRRLATSAAVLLVVPPFLRTCQAHTYVAGWRAVRGAQSVSGRQHPWPQPCGRCLRPYGGRICQHPHGAPALSMRKCRSVYAPPKAEAIARASSHQNPQGMRPHLTLLIRRHAQTSFLLSYTVSPCLPSSAIATTLKSLCHLSAIHFPPHTRPPALLSLSTGAVRREALPRISERRPLSRFSRQGEMAGGRSETLGRPVREEEFPGCPPPTAARPTFTGLLGLYLGEGL